MSEGFEVDLPALDRLIRTLEEGAQRVREANAELGGFAGVDELDDASGGFLDFNDRAGSERMDVLGNVTLAQAAKRFGTKWRYGLDKLDEAAGEVLDRLHATRRSYQALEEAYSALFDAMRGGGVPGGGYVGNAAGGIANVLGGQS